MSRLTDLARSAFACLSKSLTRTITRSTRLTGMNILPVPPPSDQTVPKHLKNGKRERSAPISTWVFESSRQKSLDTSHPNRAPGLAVELSVKGGRVEGGGYSVFVRAGTGLAA